jgi:Ca2+-binding EF-hand superfamily protein
MSVPTAEQLALYKQSFGEFDDDNDGYLETSMIERALRSIGLNPTTDEMNDIMSDVSSSNKISLNGYLYIAHHVGCYSNTEKELIKAFTLFDRDGTGKIPKNVVKEVLSKIKRPLTDGQFEQLFSKLKIDNGFVDIKQLAKALLSQ